MAIARTGYAGGINGDGSFDITVPDGTDCLIVYATQYGAANLFTGTDSGVTCEGAAADAVVTDSDTSTSYFMGAAWVFLNPPTGAGVTIAHDWLGSPADSVHFAWAAYSGVGSIRQAYGNQKSGPQFTTGALTSSSGDVISVAVFGYAGSEASVTTWSNATEISEFTRVASADLTLAEHESAGNVTIATTAVANYEDGGIMAVIMVPAAGGGAHPYTGSVGVGARTAGAQTVRTRGIVRVGGGAKAYSASTVKARGKTPTVGASKVYSALTVKARGKAPTTGGAMIYSASTVQAHGVRWYLASSMTVTDGSTESGVLRDTYSDDGVNLVVAETVGPPGFTYDFTFGEFEPVSTTNMYLHLNGWYSGNLGHNVKLYQWNYNSSAWVGVTANDKDFPDESSEGFYNFKLIDDVNYLSGGQAKIRIQHTPSGNTVHRFRIDDMHLSATGDFRYASTGTFILDAGTDVEFSSGAGNVHTYVGQGTIVFSDGSTHSLGKVYTGGGAFHFSAGTVYVKTAGARNYSYTGLSDGTIIYRGATVYIYASFSVSDVEAKPPVRAATHEALPGRPAGQDGFFAEPGQDGFYDEYPVHGFYADIGYYKEMKPFHRATMTKEGKPS